MGFNSAFKGLTKHLVNGNQQKAIDATTGIYVFDRTYMLSSQGCPRKRDPLMLARPKSFCFLTAICVFMSE
jgi:hypothetical protein